MTMFTDDSEAAIEIVLAELGWRERAAKLWEDWTGRFALVGPVFVHVGRDMASMRSINNGDLPAVRATLAGGT